MSALSCLSLTCCALRWPHNEPHRPLWNGSCEDRPSFHWKRDFRLSPHGFADHAMSEHFSWSINCAWRHAVARVLSFLCLHIANKVLRVAV